MWHTDQPSIQGAWNPLTNRNPVLNLVQFPDDSLSEPLNRQQTATEKIMELINQRKSEETK